MSYCYNFKTQVTEHAERNISKLYFLKFYRLSVVSKHNIDDPGYPGCEWYRQQETRDRQSQQ